MEFVFSYGEITDKSTNETQTIHDIIIKLPIYKTEVLGNSVKVVKSKGCGSYGRTLLSKTSDMDLPENFSARLSCKCNNDIIEFNIENCRRTGYKVFEFDQDTWDFRRVLNRVIYK